jgi:RNA polymerase sigma-70 factor, ECF subfamily
MRPLLAPRAARLIPNDAGARRSFPALQSQHGIEPLGEPGVFNSRTGADPIERMRTLDPQSLTRHMDRLYRAAWALCGSREDAEDLVQDTFARVLSKPRLLRGDDELAYLMRVLRNTFFSARRTASRRPVTAASLDEVVAADAQPMGQPERALAVHELYEAIAGLPEDFRLALVAVDIVGLSYREAAKALRTREATITTRLFRARRQVVRCLEKDSEGAHAAEAQDLAAEDPAGGRLHDVDSDAQPQRLRASKREGPSAGERLAEQRQQ